jgi:GNAT superfamily N-acetyltransferase
MVALFFALSTCINQQPEKNMITMRKASNVDKTDIVDFFKRALIELGLPFVSGESDADLQDINGICQNRGLFLVIQNDVKAILGMIAISKMDADTCMVSKFYVDSRVKGLGFGGLLFRVAMAQAKEYGYHTAELETNQKLAVAVRIFEKAGFTRSIDQSDLPKACDTRYSISFDHLAAKPGFDLMDSFRHENISEDEAEYTIEATQNI